MQRDLLVVQTALEISAVLAKLTPVERTVTLGAAIAAALNNAVLPHLHQAHLQLLMHCATAAMNGASQEHKAAADRALQGIVAAATADDPETSVRETEKVSVGKLPSTVGPE